MAEKDNKNLNRTASEAGSSERERSHAKQGAMTPEEAGHLGGIAPRRHGMSREEAGHLGGTAPHKCRGFQCQKEEKSHGSEKSSHTSEEE